MSPAAAAGQSRRDCTCPRARHHHGTRAAYDQDECRCHPCRRARKHAKHHGVNWRDANSRRPRIGVVRRIEALHTLGWSGQYLASRLGITREAFNEIRKWPAADVYAGTYTRTCDIYEQLWDREPFVRSKGERISVARTKAWAVREGFAPPMAWDDDTIDDPDYVPLLTSDTELDEIAVDRIIAGTLPNCTESPERSEAIRRLAALGLSNYEIGRRIGVLGNTVGQARLRHEIPTGRRARASAS